MEETEIRIGLETHIQLKTACKMFCSCRRSSSAEPNSLICPVCSGQPGALPVVNRKAVELAVRASVALGMKINGISVFSRKNYFYPDLPKGYQITQYDMPLAAGGSIEIRSGKKIGFRRAHLEEDAGKTLYEGSECLVDLNRAGVPLLEIVSEPEIENPEEACEFLSELRRIMRWLNVSDCDMEKGEFRADANISLKIPGTEKAGCKVEIKNLNSFRAVRKSLSYEIRRQSEILKNSGGVKPETRFWNEKKNRTETMRGKEEEDDYMYFPEPDLPPLLITAKEAASARENMILPAEKEKELVKKHSLSGYEAGIITSSRAICEYFEDCMEEAGKISPKADPETVLKLIITELLSEMGGKRKSPAAPREIIKPEETAKIASFISTGKISFSRAKELFHEVCKTREKAEILLGKAKIFQVNDEKQIREWAENAIAENPRAARDLKNGNEKAVGPIMATLMRKSGGRANPKIAAETIRNLLKTKGDE